MATSTENPPLSEVPHHAPDWWWTWLTGPDEAIKSLLPKVIVVWLIVVLLNEVYKEWLKKRGIPTAIVDVIEDFFVRRWHRYFIVSIAQKLLTLAALVIAVVIAWFFVLIFSVPVYIFFKAIAGGEP